MRLLLRSDVEGVGNKGDLVEVADGYGRNYLVPRGLAIVATPGSERQAVAMRRARDVRDAAAREQAEGVARSLVGEVVTITAQAGEGGKLFGSVTTTEVAEAVGAQTGVVIDRRQLHVDEAIRSVGTHAVQARLHPEVTFAITVEVVAAD